ncbi:MAG: PASTA domain-containing protein [Acidimicrobiia bacterium]|nr:PASTA domain-containing protein [Acidimicrobiia bacterium]
MSVSRMVEQVGRVLGGRYRLVAPIGSGASAQVFLADDTRLRRRVAVKLLHAALADDTLFLRRFESEARLVAGLSHPHIMAVHDWGHDDVPYLVTEYLSGGSMRGILDRGDRLSPSQALVVGLEAARALDHAHRRGLVHRDIKPDNLLFDSEGRLRIADFGLARALAEASVTEPSGTFLGSARYASPEQAHGRPLDGRSDVYSLALVLTESVSGTIPFDTDTALGTLMARTDRSLDVDESLGPLAGPVRRAGALEPEDRPDADGFAVSLMATAERLPRPEPLPLAGTISAGAAPASNENTTQLGADVAVAAVAADTIAPAPLGRRERKVVERRERQAERTERLAAIERGEVRRRRWPWAIVALLLLAGASVGAYFAWQSSQPELHQVPALVGQDVDDLNALVGEFGWNVQLRENRFEGTTTGEIVDQDPAAGAELEEGEDLVITISLGEPLAVVPVDLIGLELAAADLRLGAAGLALGEVTRRFDEVALTDVVLEVVEVLPELPRGSEVALVVSDGPAPRAVPDGIIGVPVADAQALLEAARLVATITEQFDDTVPEGDVVAATPDVGTEVPADSAVELVLSLGPEPIEVPDVEGLDLDDAQDALEAVGLVIIEVEGPPGQPVLTTDPPAGETVFRGDEIVIFTRNANNGNGNSNGNDDN